MNSGLPAGRIHRTLDQQFLRSAPGLRAFFRHDDVDEAVEWCTKRTRQTQGGQHDSAIFYQRSFNGRGHPIGCGAQAGMMSATKKVNAPIRKYQRCAHDRPHARQRTALVDESLCERIAHTWAIVCSGTLAHDDRNAPSRAGHSRADPPASASQLPCLLDDQPVPDRTSNRSRREVDFDMSYKSMPKPTARPSQPMRCGLSSTRGRRASMQ